MSDYRTCGACYESVHKYASVCPHCHTQLVPEARPTILSEVIGLVFGLIAVYYVFVGLGYLLSSLGFKF